MRGACAWPLAALLTLALAPPARADDVTAAELAALAARVDDSAALARLQRVDRVDGRPVDIRAALRGARGDELARRARVLAAAATGARDPTDPAAARERAREILDQQRFEGTRVPRPFQGVLRWLGDRLRPLFDWIDDLLPGGRSIPWALAALLVLAATLVLTGRMLRRRAGAAAEARERAARLRAEDPRRLELKAERAEDDGAWDLAVRLRFRAGLLRLDRAGILEYRPSLTTGEVAAAVDSPAFDELGATFDAIVYGGQPATARDAEAARRGWTEVLAVRA